MEFIKMTKKGNAKVSENGATVKLYAKRQLRCDGCVIEKHSDACRDVVCGPADRRDHGWEGSVVFVREKP